MERREPGKSLTSKWRMTGRGSAVGAAGSVGGIEGNSAANPSGLSLWHDWAVTLGSHLRVVDFAIGAVAGAGFLSLHFGQLGASGSAMGWGALLSQQARGPQQQAAEGPRTLQPQRRSVSPLFTTTG
jgi:hypothetical protein